MLKALVVSSESFNLAKNPSSVLNWTMSGRFFTKVARAKISLWFCAASWLAINSVWLEIAEPITATAAISAARIRASMIVMDLTGGLFAIFLGNSDSSHRRRTAMLKININGPSRQQSFGFFRPFDHSHGSGIREDFGKAQFFQLPGFFQAVKVEVMQLGRRLPPGFVAHQEHESWTGHPALYPKAFGQAFGKRGFPASQVSCEREDFPAPQSGSKILAEFFGFG